MNEIQIFNNPQFGEVRAVTIDNEPWFVGKDVAERLGYSNPRKALADHVDGDDKGVTKCDTLGGVQELTIINESGLYSLVLYSKLPTAKAFKRWITSEVIPSILIGELAKLLRQNGVDMGQNRLFDWMRDNGYLIRRDATDRNMPTQRSMDMGLFEVKETTITHSDGHITVNKTAKVTGKGQQYFINLFLKNS